MGRFTLVVRPDGKALLLCQDRLTDGELDLESGIPVAVG